MQSTAKLLWHAISREHGTRLVRARGATNQNVRSQEKQCAFSLGERRLEAHQPPPLVMKSLRYSVCSEAVCFVFALPTLSLLELVHQHELPA